MIERVKFKKYALIVLIIAVLCSLLLFAQEYFAINRDYSDRYEIYKVLLDLVKMFGNFQKWLYEFTAAVDVIIIMTTAVFMIGISRQLQSNDHEKYKNEKKLFFAVLKVSAVMLLTWPVELHSHYQEFDQNLILTSDIISLFTAIVLFSIFVIRDEVNKLVFRKYQLIHS